MANKKISELQSRTPALSDLMLVGDPSSGYSYKCTVTALATIIETDIADGYVTIGTTQTISGAKTFSNNLTLTSVVNTPTDPDKFLTLNASNVVTYRTGAEVLSDIGGVGGSGTTNYLPKFSATTTLANSQIFDNGTNVGIGVGSSIIAGYLLTIGGKVKIYNQIDLDNPTTNTCNAINIQKGTSISHRGVGYIQIASFNTNRLSLFFNDNNNYQADFDGSNLTTGQRYILPNATGTLALTSDLSSYVPTSRILTINGTSYDLSANRTWSVGTVTSVAALTLGTTGTDLSSSVANGTTTPVITLNIPTASATNRGALSSTDWSTFNNKQSTITLTTTGSSGSATFVSNTLNVPTYTLAGLGGISGTGTTNYIPKFTSSSAIGNSIMYEGTNAIGINTTSPTTATGYSFVTTDGANGGGYTTKVNGTISAYFYSIASESRISEQRALPLVFETSGSERLRISSTGEVGIGTSAPVANTPLTLQAASGYTDLLWLKSVGTNIDSRINFAPTGTGIAQLNNTTGTGIALQISGAEKMRLDASGNLGLGTSVPEELLELSSSNTTGGQLLMESTGSSSGNYAGMRFKIAGGSNGGYEKAGIFALRGSGGFNDLSLIFATNTVADATNVTSANEKMRLDASGNLGLGVSPSSWSSSYKAIQFGTTGSIFGESGDAANYYTTNTFIDAGGFKYITTDFALGYFQENGVHSWRTAASGTAGNAISFTQAMTLDASGNLGVGVTSPGYKVDIGGNLRLQGGNRKIAFNNGSVEVSIDQVSGSTGGLFTLGNIGIGTTPTQRLTVKQSSSLDETGGIALERNGNNARLNIYEGASQWIISPSYSSGGSLYPILFTTSIGGNNTLYLGTSGNVGIGTTSPAQLLDVNGTARGTRLNSTGGIVDLDAQTGNNFIQNSSSSMLFIANGSERMRITSGGNVGIGTTSPTDKLVVASTGESIVTIQDLDGTNQYLSLAHNGGNSYFLSRDGSSNGSFVWYQNNGTSTTERMRITSGGELLINTTSDAGDYKLQVNGNVYSTGNMVLGNGSSVTSSSGFLLAQGNTNLILDAASGTVNIRTNSTDKLVISNAGDATFSGSIKTAAPSGGTAKPIKFGEIVTLGGSNTQGVRVEIDGTVYYLVTGYLP
jgi:hypothetical protein